jgi:hypothetical protein
MTVFILSNSSGNFAGTAQIKRGALVKNGIVPIFHQYPVSD